MRLALNLIPIGVLLGGLAYNPGRADTPRLTGTYTRGASLGLGIGCVALGTTTVTGAMDRGVCQVTAVPGSFPTSASRAFCRVSAADTVEVSACSHLALQTIPSGDYLVTVE